MIKKIQTLISGVMLSSLLLGIGVPAQQAFATTNTKTSIKTGVSTKIQSKKLASFESYVRVVDNKYVLEIPSSIKNSINKNDLQLAKDRVVTLNNLIAQYKVKDVSVANGFTININDSKLASTSTSNLINNVMSPASATAGVTKIVTHWTYAEIWLSKSAVRSICIGGAAAVTAVLGGALSAIPGVNAIVATAIASGLAAVFGDSVSNANYRAVVINYYYINGLDAGSLRYQ